MLVLGVEIDVIAGAEGAASFGLFVHVDLNRGQRQELLVIKLRMIDQHVVIAVRHNRIASRLIDILDLFRGKITVGIGGMTMQIGTVEISALGNDIVFHVRYPFTRNF